MSKPRFNIGDDVWFVESSCRYGVNEPCRMCFGKRKVTVILGNDERVESECGHCSHGIDPPNGLSKTWEPGAVIHFGRVTGVHTDSFGDYVYGVGYTGGLKAYELFATQEEAVPLMERRLVEEKQRRAIWERDNFINATKKQIWSTGYHRSQIADHKSRMAWHEMRLCMIKDRDVKKTDTKL